MASVKLSHCHQRVTYQPIDPSKRYLKKKMKKNGGDLTLKLRTRLDGLKMYVSLLIHFSKGIINSELRIDSEDACKRLPLPGCYIKYNECIIWNT